MLLEYGHKVQQGRMPDIKVQSLQYLLLFIPHLFDRQLSMRDLLMHHVQLQRVYIFIFRSYEHTHYPSTVKIPDLKLCGKQLEILIQDLHSNIKSLVRAPEICQNLDHPINHPCSQRRGDLMRLQKLTKFELCFDQVVDDLSSVDREELGVDVGLDIC